MDNLAGIINFKVYEDGTDYLGIASITLPTLSNKRMTVNGAGVAGDIVVPAPGHYDAATVTISFTDNPMAAYKLSEHRRHLLDCRAAHESYDSTAGKSRVHAFKRIMEVIPITRTGGTAAPASPQGASNEYSLLSIKEYLDGKLVRHWDPLKFVDKDASGNDSLAEVRSALGM